MIDGIEVFYQRIANGISRAIPEEWSSASIEATFFLGGSVYEFEYIRNCDGKSIGLRSPNDCGQALRELRKKFAEAGKPVWGRVRYELKNDGTFSMEWGYENCDKEGYAILDEDQEIQRIDARRARLNGQ